jgi:hypothetical protein
VEWIRAQVRTHRIIHLDDLTRYVSWTSVHSRGTHLIAGVVRQEFGVWGHAHLVRGARATDDVRPVREERDA